MTTAPKERTAPKARIPTATFIVESGPKIYIAKPTAKRIPHTIAPSSIGVCHFSLISRLSILFMRCYPHLHWRAHEIPPKVKSPKVKSPPESTKNPRQILGTRVNRRPLSQGSACPSCSCLICRLTCRRCECILCRAIDRSHKRLAAQRLVSYPRRS
jgi:hypothetical protein